MISFKVGHGLLHDCGVPDQLKDFRKGEVRNTGWGTSLVRQKHPRMLATRDGPRGDMSIDGVGILDPYPTMATAGGRKPGPVRERGESSENRHDQFGRKTHKERLRWHNEKSPSRMRERRWNKLHRGNLR